MPSKTFASLAVSNYRRFFTGMLISNTGLWMARVAQDWLVLTQLTNNSSTALGSITAVQFLAMPILSPFAGSLADRYDKRKLLLVTQSASMLTAFALALLTLTGNIQLWHVFLLAGLQGVLNALDNPTRQAFASELVETPLLPNAVGLNSTSFQAARLIGPGISGLLIAGVGIGWTLLVNAVSFIAVIVALLRMDAATLHPAPRRTGRGSVREGFVYVKGRPDLQILMFVAFMLGTFGMNFQITNALMATKVFNVGPEGYGLLGSVMAVGTLAGALLAAGRAKPSMRTLIIALISFVVLSVADALAPTYVAFAILLMPVGLAILTGMTTCNATVQLSTDDGMRGRVMALYMAVFMGGTPLGAPLVGWLGDTVGPRVTLLCTTGMVAIAAVVTIVYDWRARTAVEETTKP